MQKIKEYLKQFRFIISKPEMRILPGNLAFFLVLTLVPLITLAGVICSMFSVSVTNITELFNDMLPQEIISILKPFFTSGEDTPHLIIFLIIGFFVASNGAHAIILASNTLYEAESSNYIVRRLKALFLTIILMFMFVFALVVLAFGNIILGFVLKLEFLQEIASTIYSVFILLKWPTAFVIIFFLIKVLYTMAPDIKISSKYVNKGALFTTAGWLLSTALYSFYTSHIANYDRLYGGLSSIAMLMIWIYLISYIFVLGIAINTSYYDLNTEKVNKI